MNISISDFREYLDTVASAKPAMKNHHIPIPYRSSSLRNHGRPGDNKHQQYLSPDSSGDSTDHSNSNSHPLHQLFERAGVSSPSFVETPKELDLSQSILGTNFRSGLNQDSVFRASAAAAEPPETMSSSASVSPSKRGMESNLVGQPDPPSLLEGLPPFPTPKQLLNDLVDVVSGFAEYAFGMPLGEPYTPPPPPSPLDNDAFSGGFFQPPPVSMHSAAEPIDPTFLIPLLHMNMEGRPDPLPTLKHFLSRLMRRTELSKTTFLLSLYLMVRFHQHLQIHAHHHNSQHSGGGFTLQNYYSAIASTSSHVSLHHHHHTTTTTPPHTDTLLTTTTSPLTPYALCFTSLLIASKHLYDDTYDTNAWLSVCAGLFLGVAEINAMERGVLGVLGFQLGVTRGEWIGFVRRVERVIVMGRGVLWDDSLMEVLVQETRGHTIAGLAGGGGGAHGDISSGGGLFGSTSPRKCASDEMGFTGKLIDRQRSLLDSVIHDDAKTVVPSNEKLAELFGCACESAGLAVENSNGGEEHHQARAVVEHLKREEQAAIAWAVCMSVKKRGVEASREELVRWQTWREVSWVARMYEVVQVKQLKEIHQTTRTRDERQRTRMEELFGVSGGYVEEDSFAGQQQQQQRGVVFGDILLTEMEEMTTTETLPPFVISTPSLADSLTDAMSSLQLMDGFGFPSGSADNSFAHATMDSLLVPMADDWDWTSVIVPSALVEKNEDSSSLEVLVGKEPVSPLSQTNIETASYLGSSRLPKRQSEGNLTQVQQGQQQPALELRRSRAHTIECVFS